MPPYAHLRPSLHTAAPAWRRRSTVSALLVAVLLAACGGGGGGHGGSDNGGVIGSDPQVCAPTNPYIADATAPTTLGSLDNEKAWLRATMDADYLWYAEIPRVDAAAPAYSDPSDIYASLDNYFEALKTPALTPSGKRRDAFSFTYPTRAWNDLINAGAVAGYGINWTWDSPTPPRGIRIAYVEPVSPAAAAGLQRGDVLVSADGVGADDGTQAGVDTLNAALFPSRDGESHRFVFSRGGSSPSVTLVSTTVTTEPVPTVSVLDNAGRKTGYIVFNDHMASAEGKLIDAVNTLKTAGVQDLVLDLRYNGGGYLYIASELAYMIAGPARTGGQVFERLQYNAKRRADNDSTDAKTPFYDTSCYLNDQYDCTRQQPLPTLNLSRVTVIATGATCSASEAIVNGLRGVDVDVRLIGGTTCGKPYGFTARDNCGISYFPIEFQGVNAKGFGDYADGFAPTCPATDDFDHPLGDAGEGMLAAALYNLTNDACRLSAAPSAQGLRRAPPPRLLRGIERQSAIGLPRR